MLVVFLAFELCQVFKEASRQPPHATTGSMYQIDACRPRNHFRFRFLMARSMSRFISDFLMSARLSQCFLPLPTASSTFAIPRSLKYILSGISTLPFSAVWIANRLNWDLWASSLRGRGGSRVFLPPFSFRAILKLFII